MKRLLIVAAIAAVAVFGGLFFWLIGTGESDGSLDFDVTPIDKAVDDDAPAGADHDSANSAPTPTATGASSKVTSSGVAFVVRVLGENRTPVSGTIITTQERSSVRGSWTTDVAGEARLDYEMDGRIVLLKTVDGRIVPRILEPQRGVALLYGGPPLPPPVGRVEVNGRPATEPITIRMFESSATTSSSESEIEVVTSEHGRFAFKKSPTNWARLRVDGPYFDLREKKFQLEIGADGGELVLKLTRGPTITGRVVREPDLSPAKGTTVRLSMRDQDSIAAATDGDGRFRLNAMREIKSGRLTISDHDGAEVRVMVPADTNADFDFGEIVLRLRKRISLRVYGPDGRPVRGAIAAWREDPDIVAKPTDDSGTTEIEPLFGAREIAVGAFGFRALVIAGDPNGWNSDLVANLEASSIVRVKIRRTDTQLSPVFPLRIESRASMFSPGPLPSAVAKALFSQPDDANVGHSQMKIGVALRDEIAVSGLVVGAPVRFRIDDQLGLMKLEKVTAPGATGEEEIVFEITQPLRQLIVEVSAADRPRLSKARVRLSLGMFETYTPWQMTDESGRVEFAVLARRVDIDVAHNDYLEVVGRSCRLVGDRTTAEIKLEPKLDLSITVVDDEGQPIDNAGVAARSDNSTTLLRGRSFAATAKGVGRGQYTLSGLPIGTIIVSATVNGRTVEVQHATRDPALRIEISQRGSLEIERRAVPNDPTHYFVHIVHLEAEKLEKVMPIEFAEGRRRVAKIEHLRPGPWRVELFTAATIDAPERQSVCVWNRAVVAIDESRRLVVPVKEEAAPADRR